MKPTRLRFLSSALVLGFSPVLYAQSLYWNPSPLDNTWDASSTHWAESSGGSPALAWTAGATAIFDQAATYTVTLSGAQSASAFQFTDGSVTVDLGGTSQTLGNLAITAPNASTTGTLTNGTLTLNGASNLVITPGVTTGGRTSLIDASALSSLTISKSGQTITVGGQAGGVMPGSFGTFRLSATSNTITAANINVGTTGGANANPTPINSGRLELGEANTINANTWKLGTTRDGGIVQFQTGLTAPSVTLRGENGTDAVTSILIGENAAGGTGVGTSHMNFSGASVDILVTTLTLSRGGSGSTTALTPAVNGSFSMGSGTLTAGQIWLSKNESGGLNSTNTSSFTQGGGTVKVSTLTFGETTRTTGTFLPVFNSQYTLNAGTLNAGSITAGGGLFATSTTRRINFGGGTISTLDAETDLAINGVTGTGGTIGIALGTAGSPAIDVATDRTVTLGAFTSISGAGSLLKTGPGELVMNNSANTSSGEFRPVAGSVVVGNSNALAGSVLVLDSDDTGTVSFGTAITAATLGSLKGSRNLSLVNTAGTPAAVTLTVGANNATNTYTGLFSGGGHLYKSGSGTQTLDPGSLESMSIGSLSANGGTLILKSGTINTTGIDPFNNAYVAGVGARGGTLTIDGATVNVGNNRIFKPAATGTGTVNIISGALNAAAVAVGHNGTATINQSGGTVTTTNMYHQDAGVGTYNLTNGTLVARSIYNNTANTGGSHQFTLNLNGGTLKAATGTTNLITTGNTGTQMNVFLGEGNTAIDTSDSDATIVRPMGDMTAVAGTFTKTGSGILTLTGDNTYTGATSVTAGTLALVGGSQTSPITVDSGAALGFTLGSPTSSTSSVTFSGATAKVTVTGTPVAATLMTASSITGTPVLDPAIPGFELAIEGSGTLLNLVATSGGAFATWATTTNGLAGGDASATADPDNDGLDNAVEFVIGGQPNPANPNADSSALAPTISTDANNLIFTFRRTDLALTQPGIGIKVEYGSDLTGWTTATDGENGVVIVVTDEIEAGVDQVQVSIPKTLATGAKMFARLNVVIP